MTSIWVALLAVGGFEMHLHKNVRKLFTIRVYFTDMTGILTQATMWRWNEVLNEYASDASDAVATNEGAWGKELKL